MTEKDSLLSIIGKPLVDFLTQQKGCFLLSATLLIMVSSMIYFQRESSEKTHNVQLQMVGELREIKGILSMKERNVAWKGK